MLSCCIRATIAQRGDAGKCGDHGLSIVLDGLGFFWYTNVCRKRIEDDKTPMVKLLLTYDISEGQETDYMEFVVRELGPGLSNLGLTITDAWYTIAGSGPQVIIGGVAEDRPSLNRILQDPEWHKLQQELLRYVINYRIKITTPQGLFQM